MDSVILTVTGQSIKHSQVLEDSASEWHQCTMHLNESPDQKMGTGVKSFDTILALFY